MTGGFEAGERFGDFEIIEVAGEGGMGIVYRARQITLERVVALKVISPQVADAPDFTTRFRRESRLAASIDHPHVVSVHSAGELEGRAYIAMQWVDGVGLDRLLADGAALEEGRTLRIISQLAGALDAAHAKGLIHRDVKPANVLVRSIGGADHAYLTDFGIARRVDVGATGLTKTGQTVGTIGYMAPEQIRGDATDGRADLYSLACVLYQCLTGRKPFEHDTEVAVMFAHVNEERPRPSTVRPELAKYDDVVVRALALEPDDRFQTGAELGEALAVAASGGRVPAPPTAAGATAGAAVAPAAAATRTAATQPLPPGAEPPPPPPPRATHPTEPQPAPSAKQPNTARRVLIGLGVLLLVAAVALGAIYAAGGFDTASTTVISGTEGSGGDTGGGDGGDGGGGGGSGGGSTAADQSAVVGVLGQYASAYSAQDGGAIGALLTDDVTRTGASDSGCEQAGKGEVIAAYESQFALGTGAYSLPELSKGQVEVSGDTATVSTSYSISGGGSGPISFELERSGDGWLISDIDAPCSE